MILFRNLDIGDVPPTPLTLFENFNTDKASSLLLEHAKGFGYPVGYLQEQHGQIVQNLFPIKKEAEKQISSSSKVNLELHTETAFHTYLPDYLLLLCLRVTAMEPPLGMVAVLFLSNSDFQETTSFFVKS